LSLHIANAMKVLAALATVVSSFDDHFYTHYHAQPLHNWLNDPNGPMYFNGKYHLFFQYNPTGYKWGNMHWYHVISDDLVHWKHLPVALAPDQSYDCGGVYSGSATIVHNATTGEDVPVLTYSVACGKSIVNAVPTDLSDPELIQWTKPDYNPVIPVPSNVSGGFRDPTTAWKGKDGVWRLLVGCGNGEGTCEFKSKDFIDWTYVGAFHSHGGGMWECPDFYPIPGSDKYLLKASAGGDWWSVGDYTENSDPSKPDSFTPTSGDIHDNSQKYDWGAFYASKAFYDPKKDREVLFGWVNYHCDGADWSGVQSFPRTVEIDPTDGNRIVMNPIREIENLRLKTDTFKSIVIPAKSQYVVPTRGAQLDVEITFDYAKTKVGVKSLVSNGQPGYERWESGWDLNGGDYEVNSSTALTGACTQDSCACQARCQADGPKKCKSWTFVPGQYCCLKSNVPKPVQQGTMISGVEDSSGVPTGNAGQQVSVTIGDGGVADLEGQPFKLEEGVSATLRVLVDHSIVEAYAQGGRAVTTRAYCKPSADAIGLEVVNDGDVPVTATVVVHTLDTANVLPSQRSLIV